MAENKNQNNGSSVEDVKKVIEEIAGSVRDIRREASGFEISFDGDNNIVASSSNGFSMRVPMLAITDDVAVNKTWYFLATWLAKWDDMSKRAVVGYLGYIVYPAAMSLSFDEEYVNDLKSATEAAMRREIENAGRNIKPVEEQDEQEQS